MANTLFPPDIPAQMRPKAFADFLGVSLKTVQRNIIRGMPVIPGGGKGFAKSIPVAASLEWLGRAPPKHRGRPPNVARHGSAQSSPSPPFAGKEPSAPSEVKALSLASAFVFAPQYNAEVAMQRWKCLLQHDADARFAEDIAVLTANQHRDEILEQRLKQCRIHKYLYSLAAEHGSACTYTAAIEEQLIAEGLSPSELAGVRRKIEQGFIRDALSPDGKRGDLPPRKFVERFLRAQGKATTAINLERTYRQCARSRANTEAYMVGLYKVAVSDPEFAKTRVRVQLPIVREFDGAKWSEPAYAVGDRIERGQFSVEITDEAIIVHV
jgi:hypothetical protein